MGIVYASRSFKNPCKERITGIDLTLELAALAERKKFTIYLLGAAPGIGEEVAIRLKMRYPKIKIVGIYAGSPQKEDEENILGRINKTKPDLLLVAFGAPKQDKWIAHNLKKMHLSIAIGVGGTFDFIAEKVKRAPLWMQKSGLEWFFRLILEPGRWHRQLALPYFWLKIIRIKLFSKKS
jgi:N-acetylglucosaminyldiphosphoundecaprenol N-acetyl-beta-D-mannosaminyltransferase